MIGQQNSGKWDSAQKAHGKQRTNHEKKYDFGLNDPTTKEREETKFDFESPKSRDGKQLDPKCKARGRKKNKQK